MDSGDNRPEKPDKKEWAVLSTTLVLIGALIVWEVLK